MDKDELIPLDKLLELAIVTEADIDEAIAQWEASPPEDQWRNVMVAEFLEENVVLGSPQIEQLFKTEEQKSK